LVEETGVPVKITDMSQVIDKLYQEEFEDSIGEFKIPKLKKYFAIVMIFSIFDNYLKGIYLDKSKINNNLCFLD